MLDIPHSSSLSRVHACINYRVLKKKKIRTAKIYKNLLFEWLTTLKGISKLGKAFVVPSLITIRTLISQFLFLGGGGGGVKGPWVPPLADDTTLAQFRHNLQISANYLEAGRGKNILVHYLEARIRFDSCQYRISPTNCTRYSRVFRLLKVIMKFSIKHN